MKSRSVQSILGLSVVVALAACGGASEQTENAVVADYVFTNGNVYTVDEGQPWAEAFAVRDGKFVAVGANAEIEALAGKSTERTDLGGKFVTPGFIDTIVQYFFSPRSEGSLKWGIGPQATLKTHTSDRTAGPGWGGGVVGVIFGGSGQLSYGAIAMQIWGEDDFSILTLRPIVLYNLKSMVGVYLGYNNSINYDWNASSGNQWTVPLGLTLGKTLLLGNGDGLDLSIGAYPLVARPENAAEWQLKLGISYFFN